jgi:tRNA(Ile)-lysidine synthase
VGRRLEEILALSERGGTSELHVGGGVRAVVEYGVLRMAALRTRSTSSPGFTSSSVGPELGPVRLSVPGEARFGAWRVSCRCVAPQQARRLLSGERAGALDADAVGLELLIRAWRPGDRMRPAGLGGSRSLADLFTDRRVPRDARGSLPVVESQGTIAWVPGVAAAEEFRAREDTTTAVALSAVQAPAL